MSEATQHGYITTRPSNTTGTVFLRFSRIPGEHIELKDSCRSTELKRTLGKLKSKSGTEREPIHPLQHGAAQIPATPQVHSSPQRYVCNQLSRCLSSQPF